MIKAYDTCRVTKNIFVGSNIAFIAFKKDEQIVVDDIVSNPEQPEYKFVAMSASLGKRFQLREEDLAAIDMAIPFDSQSVKATAESPADADDKQDEVTVGLAIEPNLGPIKIGDTRRVTERITAEEGEVAFSGSEYVTVLQAKPLEDAENEYLVLSPITKKHVWLHEDALSNVFSPRVILADTTLDGKLTFSKGEQAVIEMKRQHLERPDIRYHAFSPRLGNFCGLPDCVIGPEVPATQLSIGPVGLEKPSAPAPKGPKKRTLLKWIIAVCVVLIAIGFISSLLKNDSIDKNSTPDIETQQAEPAPEPTPQAKPAPEPTPQAKPAPTTAGPSSEQITPAEYDQIQDGMTYPQVVGIVGNEGMNTRDIPDFNGPEQPANVVTYVFFGSAPDAAATVVFMDGVVIGKDQKGLL